MNDVANIKIQFLCFSYSFEIYWAYYSQSSGHLFEKETRNSLSKLLEIYEDLSSLDKRFKDPGYLRLGEKTNIEENIKKMKTWSESSDKWIYNNQFMSRGMTFVFFTAIRSEILKDLKIKRRPSATFSSQEFDYSEEYVSWSGHIPFIRKFDDINKIMKDANESSSIIVTGDIRRSQHLLTYSISDEDYANRMTEFLKRSRDLIEITHGIFDKFTGDGFLAYFNEDICKILGTDFVTAFLNFNREIHNFSNSFFQDWSKTLKILPGDSIGLALGADIDKVVYKLIDYHFIAVSEGIVWATRMASGAKANQTIINNRLFERMKNDSSLSFKEVVVEPKYGEPILAKLLKINSKKNNNTSNS